MPSKKTPNASASAGVVRLGLLQHACVADPAKNLRVCADMIRDAAGRGATLLCTQELFHSRYFPQTQDPRNFDLAETIPGPTTQTLSALAKKLRVTLVASLFERRTQGLHHNTAVTFAPTGEIASVYRKMHIPDDPRFYEKYYFTPGDLNWRTFDCGKARAGTLICWDQWFPEAARLTALAGAQILLYPTAIGWWHGEPPDVKTEQRDAWQTVQRSHAITNGVFVAAVNRIGVEDDLKFWGRSFVCAPGGKLIAEAKGDQPRVLIADCDLSKIENHRRGWPFLRDRRIDAYEGLMNRWGVP